MCKVKCSLCFYRCQVSVTVNLLSASLKLGLLSTSNIKAYVRHWFHRSHDRISVILRVILVFATTNHGEVCQLSEILGSPTHPFGECGPPSQFR